MKNHYETLGLSIGATDEQIRKRYRELVRKYHPDVNPSPEAKEQFLRIQEAYQVLSDPERRRHYDALLRLRQRESARRSEAPKAASHPQTARSEPAQDARPSASLAQEAQRAILEAERAFIQGRMRAALSWAKQASRLQPRNPKGYEIQGDVYRVQGHLEAALNAYTYALQLDPHNPHLQRKFEQVVQALRRTGSSPSIPLRRHLPALSLPSEWRLYAGQSLGWGAVLFALVLTYTKPGTPLPLLGAWSWNLIVYLLLTGFLTGFLMRVSQWVAPLSDSFPWGRRQGQLSAGRVLVGLGALCFPLTLLLYLLLSLTQGGLGLSSTRIFSVIGVLTALFALVYPYDWLLTLLFGGNFLFTSALGGWYLGDSLSRT